MSAIFKTRNTQHIQREKEKSLPVYSSAESRAKENAKEKKVMSAIVSQ